MDFNTFFDRYQCLRNRLFPPKSIKALPWHLFVILGTIIILLILSATLCFTDYKTMSLIPSYISLFIIAIYTRITASRKTPTPRTDYIHAFCQLLKECNIPPNDTEKIKQLIGYAEEKQKGDDLFLPFVKPLKSVYAPILSIISYCAGILAQSFSWNELLRTSLCLVGLVIVLAFFATLIHSIIDDLTHPKKHLYQKLIDDLKQQLIFSCSEDSCLT